MIRERSKPTAEEVIQEYLTRMIDKRPIINDLDFNMDCPECGGIRCLVAEDRRVGFLRGIRTFWHCTNRRGVFDSRCKFSMADGGAKFPHGIIPPSPKEVFKLLKARAHEVRRVEIESIFQRFRVPL